MPTSSKFTRQSSLYWIIIALLSLYQLTRLVIFVNTYGGIEHDSGWHLGISRALVERGTYTTMVSSIVDPTVAAGPNIHNQFEVQAEDGGIYFYVEGSVGLARVIPDALIIMLFGNGFWQFRAASLLFYLLFLIMGSWLLFHTGGLAAALLFHAFLFFYPHLSIFLGYEALGEVPAMACALLAFALYLKGIEAKTGRVYWLCASGLVAGLALTSKLLILLPLTSLGLLWLIRYLKKGTTIKDLAALAVSGLFFPALWELSHLVVLTRLFGFDVYTRHAQQRLNILLTNGSGIVEQATWDAKFLWYKLLLISEISHPSQFISLITLVTVAVSGPFLIWHLKQTNFYRNFVILLWSGWLALTMWFIISSESGWVRHYWFSLILSVLLISLLWSYLLQRSKTQPGWAYRLGAVALTSLLFLNFYSQRQAATLYISDELVETWYQRHLAATYTRLPWSLVPRRDQQEAVDFIVKLPPTARIFYPQAHKSAEMAVLSGRILYPLERRPLMPPAEGDVVIIGPSLVSPWAKLMEKSMSQAERQGLVDTVIQRIKQECPNIAFENSYYIICALD